MELDREIDGRLIDNRMERLNRNRIELISRFLKRMESNGIEWIEYIEKVYG